MKNVIKQTNTYSAWKLNEYIFVLHDDAVTVEMPDAWKKLIGYEPGDIENSVRGLLLVLEATGRDSITGDFKALVNGDFIYENKEISVKCRDGHIKWFLVNSAIIKLNAWGKPLQVLLALTDITESKLEEQKLLQQQWLSESKLFRTVIDMIPDSLYVKDLEGRKIIANPQEVKYMGLSSEAEAIGKTDFDIYPQEVAQQFTAIDELVLKQGKRIINNVDEIVQEGQKTKWLLSSKVPLRNAQDEIIG